MTGHPAQESLRLPHGYTNLTGRGGGEVRKAYLGPEPGQRYRTELAALRGLRGRVPVPEVRGERDGELYLEEIAGWHGQEALDAGRAPEVLRLCGRLRRDLSLLDPATVPGLPGSGEVIVHGDFGPQNLIVNSTADTVLAVLDWEWCHLGSAVEDLAWTEWIVRMHHPQAVPSLGELYAGYGQPVPWPQRQAAMLRQCGHCRDFCQRWGDPAAVAMWERRIAATGSFREGRQ